MMTLKTGFVQSALIPKDCLGICMRVTFKWLALKLVHGVFKYDKLNVSKSDAKMKPYGDPFIQKLCDKTFSALDTSQSLAYTTDDVASMQHYIGLWGKKIVDANKTEFTGIPAKAGLVVDSLHSYAAMHKPEWGSFHALYSFYMKLSASELASILGPSKVEDHHRTVMAGHVVGISGSDNSFFDANSGEYTFDSSDPDKIILDIEEYVTVHYKPEKSFMRGLVILG